MKRLLSLSLLLATTACGGAEEGGSNVALRDMDVIDGTANDSMVDLDNVQSDIAPMANAAAPVTGGNSAAAAAPANESDSGAVTEGAE